MTKYIKQTAAPEVQAQTTSSQAPQTQSNDLQSAAREPRVHPTEKCIIINPHSEHKLGLVNNEFKKLGLQRVMRIQKDWHNSQVLFW